MDLLFYYYYLLFWLLFLLFWFVAKALHGAGVLTKKIHIWSAHRKVRSAVNRTRAGFCAWIHGKWRTAEKQLASAANLNSIPIINYLLAADSAAKQGEAKQCDLYLKIAHKRFPECETAILLYQAELL